MIVDGLGRVGLASHGDERAANAVALEVADPVDGARRDPGAGAERAQRPVDGAARALAPAKHTEDAPGARRPFVLVPLRPDREVVLRIAPLARALEETDE